MPTYAILGSTGNVGLSLLTVLLKSPENKIHAYCRSKDKLAKLNPAINDSNQVEVFEGNLDDIELLSRCLSGTRAAFLAVAEKFNRPGVSVAQDTARNVVAAMERLKAKDEKLPKLIVLSSASTEHRLMPNTPHFLLTLLYTALSNIYDDLKAGEKILRDNESLVNATYIKPGALSHAEPAGYELSLTEARSPTSFLDLAAGMVEVADDDGGRYDMKAVAVNSTGRVAFPREAPFALLTGLLLHYFPFLAPYIT